MISASLSLSLPRLGWKSTSMQRSLKICTAAGESASEKRTMGFVIGVIRVWTMHLTPSPPGKSAKRLRVSDPQGPSFLMDGRGETRHDDEWTREHKLPLTRAACS